MMNKWLWPAVWWSLALTGCQHRDEMPAWPPFAMTVPDDVPGAMTVQDKDGTAHPANGKELYADRYRAGWKRCVQDYEAGRLDLAARRVEPPPLGHFRIVVRGWDHGYHACWAAIRNTKA